MKLAVNVFGRVLQPSKSAYSGIRLEKLIM